MTSPADDMTSSDENCTYLSTVNDSTFLWIISLFLQQRPRGSSRKKSCQPESRSVTWQRYLGRRVVSLKVAVSPGRDISEEELSAWKSQSHLAEISRKKSCQPESRSLTWQRYLGRRVVSLKVAVSPGRDIMEEELSAWKSQSHLAEISWKKSCQPESRSLTWQRYLGRRVVSLKVAVSPGRDIMEEELSAWKSQSHLAEISRKKSCQPESRSLTWQRYLGRRVVSLKVAVSPGRDISEEELSAWKSQSHLAEISRKKSCQPESRSLTWQRYLGRRVVSLKVAVSPGRDISEEELSAWKSQSHLAEISWRW